MRHVGLRIDADRLGIVADGAVLVAAILVHVPAVDVGKRVARVRAHRFGIVGDGLMEVIKRKVSVATVEVGGRVLPLI